AETEAGADGKVWPHVDRTIEVDEGLKAILAEVPPVTSLEEPLQRSQLRSLEDHLVLVAIRARSDSETDVRHASGGLIRPRPTHQLPHVDSCSQQKADSPAMVQAVSGRGGCRRHQPEAQQRPCQRGAGPHSFFPNGTAPDPALRMQIRST